MKISRERLSLRKGCYGCTKACEHNGESCSPDSLNAASKDRDGLYKYVSVKDRYKCNK